jgi:lipopolysaccharide/colanic/teichoic acid biosynthesis glycosyltransferase
MNHPKRRIPQTTVEPSDAESDTAVRMDTPVSRPALFLAWKNARQISDCQSANDPEPCIVAPSPDATSDWRRDRGLWLLRNRLMCSEGWTRIDQHSAATPLLRQRACPPIYAATKRVCDIVGSLVLLLLLLPILLLIAALVRLDSSGPAIFRQRRIGKDGKEFLLWKFRSMYCDAPQYAASPTSALDPRLTRIGRLIRRVSMDELPQLVNVLKGEMSLVGPRPEMPYIVDGYSLLERQRLAVKPGITGLWQVSPARAFPIHENLHYDLHYIEHRSLMLDGVILLRTIVAVVRGVGAV